MRCEVCMDEIDYDHDFVLILVLVEYALRDAEFFNGGYYRRVVLILVLVEYALRGKHFASIGTNKKVLILVLVEYALRDLANESLSDGRALCLNPCFSGICAARPMVLTLFKFWMKSLNPCFSGICAASNC